MSFGKKIYELCKVECLSFNGKETMYYGSVGNIKTYPPNRKEIQNTISIIEQFSPLAAQDSQATTQPFK